MTSEYVGISAENVLEALRAADVLAAYSLSARTSGATFRLSVCPRCGATSSSWAIVINSRKGTWGHYGHGKQEGGECYGNILDLVAACEGLDLRQDFGRVLARAAEIAGISMVSTRASSAVGLRMRMAARERYQSAQDAAADAERRRGAAHEWSQCRRSHEAGERYLRSRGLDPRVLVDTGHVLFNGAGEVCVRLHDLVDGELVTVARRLLPPAASGSKVFVAKGGTTRGTLCGRVKEVGPGDTIVTEGITDTLTALLCWPKATVLGAHCAGQIRSVVEAAAPRVLAAGGRLVLVPDGDDVGQRCAISAGETALRAGLVMDQTLVVLELDQGDLNEAHCAGWHP